MSFSSLIAAAKEVDQTQPHKCSIRTRDGGCSREASKYKYDSLVSKFELYNVDPPILKEGHLSGDSSSSSPRICKEHNQLPPRKYDEDERPDMRYESMADLLKCEEKMDTDNNNTLLSDMNTSTNTARRSKRRRTTQNNSSRDNSPVDGGVDEAFTKQCTEINNDNTSRTSKDNSRDGAQLQERHCIYLKVEDDEKCRGIAQTMGLARGPNGYNRSGLLATVPRLAAENDKLKAQVRNLELKVQELQQSLAIRDGDVEFNSAQLPANNSEPQKSVSADQCSTLEPKVKATECQESSSRLPKLKRSDKLSWVHILAKNLTEVEIIALVNVHGDGKLRKYFYEQYKDELDPDGTATSSSPSSGGNKRHVCRPASVDGESTVKRSKK